jgi:hypothetical protein
MASPRESIEAFSLRGGPLQRVVHRLGLALGQRDGLGLGLALAAALWAVLMTLAVLEGKTSRLLSLDMIGGHVRIGVVIPLLFSCDRTLDARIRAFLGEIVHTGVIPVSEYGELERVLLRIRGWKDGALADFVCLLSAVLMLLYGNQLHLPGSTSIYDPRQASASLTAQWYWFGCLTLYRVLMLRWVWRIGLSWYLLLRLAKLRLRLFAPHPDRMGGLGNIELVQANLLPLVFALSAVQSAALAEGIARGSASFEASYPTVLLTLVVGCTLLLTPLFFFMAQFWSCRVNGLDEYSQLATRYVRDFEDKWVRGSSTEPLLGTSDLQSLADLGNSVRVVQELQWVPIPLTLLKRIVIAGLVPFAPLILLEYPVAEIAKDFFKILL